MHSKVRLNIPNTPEPEFAAAELQKTKGSSALRNYVSRICNPAGTEYVKRSLATPWKTPLLVPWVHPRTMPVKHGWINKLLQSKNQTHFCLSVPPLSAKSGKVKWRHHFMAVRGKGYFRSLKLAEKWSLPNLARGSQDTISGQSYSSSYLTDG